LQKAGVPREYLHAKNCGVPGFTTRQSGEGQRIEYNTKTEEKGTKKVMEGEEKEVKVY